MMNKNGMLGNVIGLFLMILIGFTLYGVLVEQLQGVKDSCIYGNETISNVTPILNFSVTDCSMFEDDNYIGVMWDYIPLFFIFTTVLVAWQMFKTIWRGFDFDWGSSYSYTSNDNDDSDRDKDFTKKTCKKNNVYRYSKSKTKVDKEVKTGTGISWGEGIDKYGDSERRK